MEWMDVWITGPRLPKEAFREIVFATDQFFQWGSGGNDSVFNHLVCYLFNFDPEAKDHIEWDARHGFVRMKTDVLTTDAISTCSAYGPTSWVLPNGKVNAHFKIPAASDEDIVADLKAFSKRFPRIELTVTVEDKAWHIVDGRVYSFPGPSQRKGKRPMIRRWSKNKEPLSQKVLWLFRFLLPPSLLDKIIIRRREFWAGMCRPEQFFTELELREIAIVKGDNN